MNSQQGTGAGTSVLVLGVLVVIMILVRRGRQLSSSTDLNPGERIRPIAITALDPVISLVIIASYLYHLVATSVWHAIFAVVGGGVGVVIGFIRSRIMYVRAVPERKSIVLRRSGLEYAMVGLLIVLRLTESSLHLSKASLAATAVSALASLGLFEAISRSAFIVVRYWRDSTSTSPQVAEE